MDPGGRACRAAVHDAQVVARLLLLGKIPRPEQVVVAERRFGRIA